MVADPETENVSVGRLYGGMVSESGMKEVLLEQGSCGGEEEEGGCHLGCPRLQIERKSGVYVCGAWLLNLGQLGLRSVEIGLVDARSRLEEGYCTGNQVRGSFNFYGRLIARRGSFKTAWKRENLRTWLSSVPSLEETGLDPALYGEGLSPRVSVVAMDKSNGVVRAAGLKPSRFGRMTAKDGEIVRHVSSSSSSAAVEQTGRLARIKTKIVEPDANEEAPLENDVSEQENLVGGTGHSRSEEAQEESGTSGGGLVRSAGSVGSGETIAEVWDRLLADKKKIDSLIEEESHSKEEKESPILGSNGNKRNINGERTSKSISKPNRLSGISEGDQTEDSPVTSPRKFEDPETHLNCTETSSEVEEDTSKVQSVEGSRRLSRSSSGARNRWRRLKHTVAFAAQMSQIRKGAADLLEENSYEQLQRLNIAKDNTGITGTAALEGEKTSAQRRPRGRKGMEGMLVQQDKSFITKLQDFYVACLKMPMGRFLVGVFVAPVALGLLFTPVFLLDMGGLSFNGRTLAETSLAEGPAMANKHRCTVLLNVFLYALSLSTTFGGSPVVALSPFCLLVANVNTLMAQFLFVFLSGAVFARMSQPSHPLRCSKKAVIRSDDFDQHPGEEKYRVFAVRLVLTGPAPCELVDAKICLTFRNFVKLPSGSMFCATQDLELVRPEVSYLRYGLMVRHIIDKKSPLFGHTMESLREGDASFSLTVMGLERTSMQPIFHLEDYFVCDGDVVWDGDYMDFIHINREGQRVLDHSKVDLLKSFKVAGMVSQAISRMEADVAKRKDSEAKEVQKQADEKYRDKAEGLKNSKGWYRVLRARPLWRSKSTSFTSEPVW